MPNHRDVIKWLIVFVIVIVIGWTVWNVSEVAYKYHPSPIVISLGFALGAANALGVAAFTTAKTNRVRLPAGVAIAMFATMSAALQILLYLETGAPMAAALAFGLFGPLAEAVLSWLLVALSEEPVKVAKPATSNKSATAATASNKPATATVAATGAATVAQPLATHVKPLLTLGALVQQTDNEIAQVAGVSRQAVNKWRNAGNLEQKIAEKLPELATVHVNGVNGAH